MRPTRTYAVALYAGLSFAAVLQISALPSLAAVTSAGRVEPAQAGAFVTDLGAQAINVLRQPGQTIERREAIFRDILAQKFALDFIGRFALGRHWQALSADQQEEYIMLFSEFVLGAYASMLGGYVDEQFQVLGVTQAGQYDMIVSSRITGGGREPMRVDWRVRQVDAHPQIIDVSVGGVSMSITQREEFSSLVQRDGVQGLLEVLRARTLRLPAEGIE
ncbi:MAG: ABC transporter substrate-binding protein [Alphaproteobacteria bacterium]